MDLSLSFIRYGGRPLHYVKQESYINTFQSVFSQKKMLFSKFENGMGMTGYNHSQIKFLAAAATLHYAMVREAGCLSSQFRSGQRLKTEWRERQGEGEARKVAFLGTFVDDLLRCGKSPRKKSIQLGWGRPGINSIFISYLKPAGH